MYDTANPSNYYVTITLTSDGTTVQWSNYTAGSGGYYLDGINLSYNSGISAYQLAVNTIYNPGGGGGGGGGAGPFPDTPPATPAVYSGTSEPIILQVVGDQIVDNHGHPVLLKGIVRPSLEWNATGQYLSTQDLSNIANWDSGGSVAKSNVIRLDLYQGPGTYVVTLIQLKDEQPVSRTSRTILIAPFKSPTICPLVCPPNNVQIRRLVRSHNKTLNVISWKAPGSENYCNPLFTILYAEIES